MPEADALSGYQLVSKGLRLVLVSILLISVLYTLAVTGIGNLIWGEAAKGGLVKQDGQVVGSKLIGQEFTSDEYFHPRPSSKGYDGMDSGSANLAPDNDRLTERAKNELRELEKQGIKPEEVPISFVTESGSSLDPDIRPQSAYLQVPRVSENTGIAEDKLREVIDELTGGKFLGLFGQTRVNVLSLNLRVEEILRSKNDE
ncbi:K(+)-transporting ATPase subunit C [Candidatus Bipolaricaulota bacterium]|nr:K(+)-transporting ATPase subunit C [Candidatus Bipolaricaulota bacterium]